jgi:uncharacterized Zn finger protein
MSRSYRENPYSPDPYLAQQMTPAREWWAQRWIDVLESFGFRQRMARARNYAQSGNILSLEFKEASVVAKVQGTAPKPYKVKLQLDPFSDEQWSYVVESMAEQAIFSAKLLAGEMPQDIETVFTQNGLSLFPFNQFDIHSRCDCPDPVNPCKHIGAVYYLLGDRFGEDPFVLFQLRGRSKAQILEELRGRRRVLGDAIAGQPEGSPSTAPIFPVTVDPIHFWNYDQPIDPALIFLMPATGDSALDLIGQPLDVSESERAAWVAAWQERLSIVSQEIFIQAQQTDS